MFRTRSNQESRALNQTAENSSFSFYIDCFRTLHFLFQLLRFHRHGFCLLEFDTLIKNNLLNEKFELEITPSLDSTSIIEINVEYENYNFTLYDLNFIYENIDTTEVFLFNFLAL